MSEAWSERHGRGPDALSRVIQQRAGRVPGTWSSGRHARWSRGEVAWVASMPRSSDFCRVVEANQAFTPIKRDASAMLARC